MMFKTIGREVGKAIDTIVEIMEDDEPEQMEKTRRKNNRGKAHEKESVHIF